MQEKRWPTSWTNDRSNLRVHILPEWATLPMRGVTREHGKALAHKLDTAVRDGKMRDRTARNIWHTATGLFDDAANSAEPGIAILDVSPLARLRGPTDQERRARRSR